MASPYSQKRFSRRQDERPHNTGKTTDACAEFNALFQPDASDAARRREADARARDAAIAEVRLQVERYAFQPAELGF